MAALGALLWVVSEIAVSQVTGAVDRVGDIDRGISGPGCGRVRVGE